MATVELSRLVDSMGDPSFYPHPVGRIELIQTHISCVALTGEYAYKLKKPKNFGFLDFSTQELRRTFCELEVKLNRRLAPSVYLRVLPVTLDRDGPTLEGSGPILDWVVMMRQMDQGLLGSTVLDRGDLTPAKIEAVVDTLVPFYRMARSGPGVDEYGGLDTVRFNTDENFEQTSRFVGAAIPGAQFREIRAFTDRFYQDRADLFPERIRGGWVRECHGDLHLGNIFFEQPPVIFDCIEFNERFRCSDVAVDLAFLVMDLDFRGEPDLARRVVSRYVEEAGDEGFLDLVDFYCCYRAYVRGKIACFTSEDPGLDESHRENQIGLARRYFDLAHGYATETRHGRDG